MSTLKISNLDKNHYTLESLEVFACPKCLGNLNHENGHLRCINCNTAYTLKDGIPSFSRKEDYYYGEIPKPDMHRLIKATETVGWDKAFNDLCLTLSDDDYVSFLAHYAMDEKRAAWKFLLEIPQNGRVLDLGCGWGNISFSLARNFKEVVAMDLAIERVQILRQRAGQLNINNIIVANGGDTEYLPFVDKAFDAVTLNGVLEWVPRSMPDNPRRVQLHLLNEIARILKKDGQIYVGIENRIGYRYFLGKPEEHSGLKYASLIPRFMADIYSKRMKKRPFRTYTYTIGGYRQLLRDSGFAKAKFFLPYPDYREFSMLVDLSNKRMFKSAFMPLSKKGKLAQSIFSRVNLLKFIAPSFGIIGSKDVSSGSFLDRLILHVQQHLSQGKSIPPSIERISISHTDSVFVVVCTSGYQQKIIIHIPLTPRAEVRAKNQAAILRTFKNPGGMPYPVSKNLPRLLMESEYEGQSYYVQSYIDGVPATHFVSQPDVMHTITKEAIEHIIEQHRATAQNTIFTEEIVKSYFYNEIDRACRIKPGCLSQVTNSELKTLFQQSMLHKNIPLVLYHGDYWLQNIIVDQTDHHIKGIVDWDLGCLNGLPMMDPLRLLVAIRIEQENLPADHAYLRTIEHFTINSLEKSVMDEYMKRLSICPDVGRNLTLFYLLYQIRSLSFSSQGKAIPLAERLEKNLIHARDILLNCFV